MVWETVARNYFFIFFSAVEVWFFFLQSLISSCRTLSLIRLYLDNIANKCNRAASCLFMKELALLWCGRQLLEIISLFFSLLSKFGFSFCSP